MRARRTVICLSDLHQNDTHIDCLVARQTTDHWAHAMGPWTCCDMTCRDFSYKEGNAVCSIGPFSLIFPTCLGLLFARLLRQVKFGRRSANAKGVRGRPSSVRFTAHCSVVTNWLKPADAHSSCHQHQYPRRLVLPLGWAVACLTTPYDIAISQYTGVRYRRTVICLSDLHQNDTHIDCLVAWRTISRYSFFSRYEP